QRHRTRAIRARPMGAGGPRSTRRASASAEDGREGAAVGLAQLLDRDLEDPLDGERAAAGGAQHLAGHLVPRAEPGELLERLGAHADERPRDRLAEQVDERVATGELDRAADA